MRLLDLEPQFIRYEVRTDTWTQVLGDPTTWKPGDPTQQVTGPRVYHVYANDVNAAQGIMFLCPACFKQNGGAIGTHQVVCWFAGRGVPDEAQPLPGRWQVGGFGYDDLTLSPSIVVGRDAKCCGWHGHIRGGNVT